MQLFLPPSHSAVEPTETYVFRLEIAIVTEKSDPRYLTLTLPLPHREIVQIEMDFDPDLRDMICTRFESIVPALERMKFDLDDLAIVNALARSISHIKERGQLTMYIDLIDTLESVDLNGAVAMSHLMV